MSSRRCNFTSPLFGNDYYTMYDRHKAINRIRWKWIIDFHIWDLGLGFWFGAQNHISYRSDAEKKLAATLELIAIRATRGCKTIGFFATSSDSRLHRIRYFGIDIRCVGNCVVFCLASALDLLAISTVNMVRETRNCFFFVRLWMFCCLYLYLYGHTHMCVCKCIYMHI